MNAKAARTPVRAKPPRRGKNPTLGKRLREIRRSKNLTLMEVSKLTGLAASTISKVENEEMSLTYDRLLQLANGLEISVAELFPSESPDDQASGATGRRSINTAHTEYLVKTPNYEYHFLCTDLTTKHMIPVIGVIKARNLAEFGPLVRHEGEEFLYVIEGEVEVHTEHYRPAVLGAGQSMYIDSTMGHAYVSRSQKPARLLVICSCAKAQTLESALAHGRPVAKASGTA